MGTGRSPPPLALMAALCPGQGTRDHPPAQAALRERLLSAVVSCFKRHGAAAIDTPVLELRVSAAGALWSPPGCGRGPVPGALGPSLLPPVGLSIAPFPSGFRTGLGAPSVWGMASWTFTPGSRFGGAGRWTQVRGGWRGMCVMPGSWSPSSVPISGDPSPQSHPGHRPFALPRRRWSGSTGRARSSSTSCRTKEESCWPCAMTSPYPLLPRGWWQTKVVATSALRDRS